MTNKEKQMQIQNIFHPVRTLIDGPVIDFFVEQDFKQAPNHAKEIDGVVNVFYEIPKGLIDILASFKSYELNNAKTTLDFIIANHLLRRIEQRVTYTNGTEISFVHTPITAELRNKECRKELPPERRIFIRGYEEMTVARSNEIINYKFENYKFLIKEGERNE